MIKKLDFAYNGIYKCLFSVVSTIFAMIKARRLGSEGWASRESCLAISTNHS